MAKILQKHFSANITFITPINTYKTNTPDIEMCNLLWEMKAPKTNKMLKVIKDIKEASKQSPNIIISGKRTKIRDFIIHDYLQQISHKNKHVAKIIFINKHNQVLTIC
jgi:hypothetical protein